MRLSTSYIQQLGLNSMLGQQYKLSKTQQQLATGNKIITPSDDPAGTAQAYELDKTLAALDQFERNVGMARARMSTQEGVLNDMANALQRLRDLAVQSGNATLSTTDRQNLALETRELWDQLVSQANSKDPTGAYMFAGYSGLQAPFEVDGTGVVNFVGDQGQQFIEVGFGRRIRVAETGMDVLMKIPKAGVPGQYESIFESVRQFADNLDAGLMDTASIAQFDNALHNIIEARGRLGGRMNALEGQNDINLHFQHALRQTVSDIRDLDYAEAMTRLNQQLVGLEAAQKTYHKVQGLSLFNYM